MERPFSPLFQPPGLPGEQPRPPFNLPPTSTSPPGIISHKPGELFPGRASAAQTDSSVPSPDAITTPEYRTAAVDLVEAIQGENTPEITIDRLSYSGIRATIAERRAKRAEKRLASLDEADQQPAKTKSRKRRREDLQEKWGEAAEKGQSYGKVDEDGEHYSKGDILRPRTQREEAIAQKAYKAKDHKKTALADMHTAEGGTYEINPGTGKSKHRMEDPKLKGFTRATRRSIRKEERQYARTKKKVEHANHILHPHHAENTQKERAEARKGLSETVENRRKIAEKRKKKAEISTIKRDIRQSKRWAFAGEVAKAWRGRTEEALEHEEKYYEDLSRAMGPGATGADEKMRVKPYEPWGEGGKKQWLARRRAARHKHIMDNADKKDLPRVATRRKDILEKRAEKYRKHERTTDRRKNNAGKLAARRRKTDERYQDLREAQQKLRNLGRPSGDEPASPSESPST